MEKFHLLAVRIGDVRRRPKITALDDLAVAVARRAVAESAIDVEPLLPAYQVLFGHGKGKLRDEVLDIVRSASGRYDGLFIERFRAGPVASLALAPLRGEPGDERIAIESLPTIDHPEFERSGRLLVREIVIFFVRPRRGLLRHLLLATRKPCQNAKRTNQKEYGFPLAFCVFHFAFSVHAGTSSTLSGLSVPRKDFVVAMSNFGSMASIARKKRSFDARANWGTLKSG